METLKTGLEQSSELVIIRVTQNAYQCNGGFMLFDDKHQCIMSGKTLELPYLNNQAQISSIPAGTYSAHKMYHRNFGNCFYLPNVPERFGIFVHVGNFHNQIKGCILLGSALVDINADGLVDVINSHTTLDKAFKLLTKKFLITIL